MPNAVTLIRTVLSVVLALSAVVAVSPVLLASAYLVYWVGDIADGEVARRLGLETRIGAVLDIVADRVNSLLCAACFVSLDRQVVVPISVYVVEFALVDTMLSLGFLAFEVKGPNDFHTVDLLLWRWNWSRPAKALNASVIVFACVAGHAATATVVACAVLVLKTWSCARMHRLTQNPALA